MRVWNYGVIHPLRTSLPQQECRTMRGLHVRPVGLEDIATLPNALYFRELKYLADSERTRVLDVEPYCRTIDTTAWSTIEPSGRRFGVDVKIWGR